MDGGGGETNFGELGVNLVALGGGEPIGMYHWEAECEDFLVLSGDDPYARFPAPKATPHRGGWLPFGS